MMEFKTNKFNVRYYETDQMGFVHHSNYLKYFEKARIDWLDSIGLSYSDIEKSGIILPVVNANIRFIYPAFFGDTLEIKLTINSAPTAKIDFNYFVLFIELLNMRSPKILYGSQSPKPRAWVRSNEFAKFMRKAGPFETKPHLAIAVSGGADSMALCLLAMTWARRRNGTVTALTVDHGLRRESFAEAKQVAIWLNESLFPAYDYWQFWRNSDDKDVKRFLKFFTEIETKKN